MGVQTVEETSSVYVGEREREGEREDKAFLNICLNNCFWKEIVIWQYHLHCSIDNILYKRKIINIFRTIINAKVKGLNLR